MNTVRAETLTGQPVEGYPVRISGKPFVLVEDIKYWVDLSLPIQFAALCINGYCVPLGFVAFKENDK